MAAQRSCIALALPLLLAGMACGRTGEAPVPQETLTIVKESGSSSRTGFLGVSTQDMSPSVAKEKDLGTKTGALVNAVTEDSPAEKAGIQENDVIVEFNGIAIGDAEALVNAVRKTQPGSKATIVVMRGREKKTLQATIGKRPSARAFTVPGLPHIPAVPHVPRFYTRVFRGGTAQGLRLMDLNSQLREYFGTPEGKGVLVEAVDKRSAAKDAGFKAGDVILRVGASDVEDTEDVRDALEDVKPGDSTTVEILRRGSRMTLRLGVDEEEDPGTYFRFRSRSDADPDAVLKMLKEESLKQRQCKSRLEKEVSSRQKEFKLQLEKEMKRFQEELRSTGREIRSRMELLRRTLGRELRQVIGQQSPATRSTSTSL